MTRIRTLPTKKDKNLARYVMFKSVRIKLKKRFFCPSSQ